MKLRLYSLLGFAKRAKKLVCGMTNCVYAVRKKNAQLVIIATDAGVTRKKLVRECQIQDIPLIEYGTRDQFIKYLGSPVCYWAVLSQELAKEILRNFEEGKDNQYGGD